MDFGTDREDVQTSPASTLWALVAERPIALPPARQRWSALTGNLMGQSKPFSPFSPYAGSFEPEALSMLGRAYDLAIANMHDTGQPDAVRDLIADRIMLLARKGERDIHVLCRAALRGISLPL